MKCLWDKNDVTYVLIHVKNFPAEGISLEELKPLIKEIREKSTNMIINIDMSKMGLIGIERFNTISCICQEVIEYTKDDNLLRKIEIKGSGFIFRTLYKPLSMALPKFFRDIIVFL
jgi:hypothetical protein